MPLVSEIKHIYEPNPLACGQAVLAMLSGKTVDMTVETGENGCVTIHAVVDGLIQKFVFTPI